MLDTPGSHSDFLLLLFFLGGSFSSSLHTFLSNILFAFLSLVFLHGYDDAPKTVFFQPFPLLYFLFGLTSFSFDRVFGFLGKVSLVGSGFVIDSLFLLNFLIFLGLIVLGFGDVVRVAFSFQ